MSRILRSNTRSRGKSHNAPEGSQYEDAVRSRRPHLPPTYSERNWAAALATGIQKIYLQKNIIVYNNASHSVSELMPPYSGATLNSINLLLSRLRVVPEAFGAGVYKVP